MHTFRQPIIVFLLLSISIIFMSFLSTRSQDAVNEITIPDWSIAWIQKTEPVGSIPPSHLSWQFSAIDDPLTTLPSGTAGAWVRISIPPTSGFKHPGIYINRLYGLDITVYEDDQPVYKSSRDYDFEPNILLIPLNAKPEASDLYIRIVSKEGAGIGSDVRIGEFTALSSSNVHKMLPNVLLGAAIAFLGFIMLVSTGFFVRNLTRTSITLSLFILSTGILIVTNSSLPYYYYPDYGPALFFLFDVFMLILFPALFCFVIRFFEEAYSWLMKFEKWVIGYFGVSLFVMVAYKIVGGSFYWLYKLFTFWILAPVILGLLVLIIILAIRSAFRKERSSMFISIGFVGLALSGIADLSILFFRHGVYEFVLWKLGLVFLIACLVMALNRRIAGDYSKLLSYSKELEMYNYQLQQSERMQIISELAASIAHEIRNPLQVTRGFLQLLSRNATEANKNYYGMAINELDRAAGIITDYLTFAKPEQETMVLMDVKQELSTMETIIRPMVMLHGGILNVEASEHLKIIGSSAKFKQAFMNMLKNSVESLQEDGTIDVVAYEENSAVVIRISDNGLGMDEDQLAKLGNPYFSTKTKGTGLGLMVTFRIIEAMNGTLVFHSEKGKGTEATIRFPLANQD
ncbi:signal transduction histidine kinase [Paenibacillus phyllosphaerae]|uniref:histidine kinase n=1 Tax=Paenibacillus phyllosphaerae TaxID=274593 RepID=A0A7W5B2D4_9BACL|nr:sensor histidine kinase [Paenibacillus phyllosphaerae]MBB3112386.1 signal transduction histidine kinase [Paenibacillus phyllosphaerae]